MRTRSNFYPFNSTTTIPKRSNRRRIPNIVEPEIRTIEEIVPMDDRTMKELLQALTEGYGEATVVPEILDENFEIKTNLLQFEERFGEDWDHFKEMLRACPHHGFLELTQIDMFYNGLTEQDQDSLNAASGGNLLNKTTREALKIIENKSKFHYSRSKSNVSRVNTNSRDNVSKTDDRIDKLADQNSNLVEIVNKQVIAPAKAVEKTCVTCGGAHAYYDCIATDSNQPNVCAATGSYNQVSPPNQASHQIPPPSFASVQNNPNRFNQNQGTLSSNTVPNPKKEMKAVTTRSGLAYEGPSIPTSSPLEKGDEQNTEEILDKEHSKCPGTKVPLNENCSAMLLKKLPEKLGDPGKFLIPCDFPEMEVCHALADLGASINLMPLSIWKKLLLPELTPTRMTLKLVDRSITHPKGVTEDVFVKVGKFYFLTDFVVVDFEADPRVPLILGRSFLRGRALIDVYGKEITLRYNPKSSNPTLVFDVLISKSDSCKKPIVKSSSPTLTPFGETEESKAKSSVEEPPELELKELPSHLEYAFLEDSNKLPKIFDIKGIDPRFCTHKILMEDDYKPEVHSQRRVNPKFYDVIKKEVIKLFDAGMIYPISDSPWVSPIHCVPKKRGMTVVANENHELIPTRLVTSWRVCIDYRKLNDATKKDHFSLPFMDQMLERLVGHEFYCFLDGFSGYFQIPIDPQDQEKTTFTCPYGTFAYRRMPFGFCNAPGIEVDRAKVDVLAKLPHPTTVKGVRSFLGHAGFYRHFIQDFSKIARPMTHLLEKETPFEFSKECIDAFNTLKKKLTEAPILVIKKGSENLATDHLSRLENPHQDVEFHKEGIDIIAEEKGFQRALKFSKLAMRDLLEAIMVPILQRRRDKEKSLRKMRCLRKLSKFVRYLIYGVDAKAFPTNDARVVVKFLKSLFSRFAYHPQTSGQVEVTNCGLKRILERTTAGDHHKLQVNELSELCDQAYENSMIYKERTKKLHDSRIKNCIFNVGDQVLLFNSRLKIFSGKLKTRWSGPFTITRVFPYGTIELSQPNGLDFKVNGHRVKHYFGGDIPSNVALFLHTFPMDN
nr:DNA-directed DNA polymerase [Tanacetum cinerariifolium]